MLSAADNELLTRSGAGTPMGEYFRRFWQPAALSRELAEPMASTPQVLGRFIASEVAKWRSIITTARISIDP